VPSDGHLRSSPMRPARRGLQPVLARAASLRIRREVPTRSRPAAEFHPLRPAMKIALQSKMAMGRLLKQKGGSISRLRDCERNNIEALCLKAASVVTAT